MCRLFGFRSVIPSQVHRSLLAAENALGVQSNAHPDGWGVAYYVNGAPHVTRSPETAVADSMFHRLSGIVSSETVLAHVRKATRGPKTVLNCHPFQYGRWVFAHNGDIPNFDSCRDALLGEVDARIRRFILGETDSEVVFFIFLSELLKAKHLTERRTVGEAVTALRGALERVRAVCDREGEEPASLTVMATDGETMVAAHGGKELFWSSHKTVCGDRATCTSLSPECEAPSRSGRVNHLIISSEPLLGENVWQPMSHGDILGIDWRMHFVHAHTHHRPLLPLAPT